MLHTMCANTNRRDPVHSGKLTSTRSQKKKSQQKQNTCHIHEHTRTYTSTHAHTCATLVSQRHWSFTYSSWAI